MASQSQVAVLSATSVDKRFNALVVLNQVNFTPGEREAVGIVGPNGAGKTTLLNILAGAYEPSAGTVSFRGQDITSLPIRASLPQRDCEVTSNSAAVRRDDCFRKSFRRRGEWRRVRA